MRRLTLICLLTAVALGLPGCAAVKPWERSILARAEMTWEPDAGEASLRSQVFYSKEASLAGGSAGGGGCGCN